MRNLLQAAAGDGTAGPGPAPGPARWLSGAYLPASTQASLAAFGTWRGRTVDISTTWSARAIWNDIVNPSWLYTRWRGYPGIVAYGVAMLPETVTGVTLAAGASGAYDSFWTQFANNIVAGGMDRSIIRLGWEFNGNWYVWQAADHTSFVAYWQRIVNIVRPIAPNLDWCWNVNRGVSGGLADPTLAWPGDSYVTTVAVDSYDQYPPATTSGGWNTQLNGTQGLNYWLDFAKSHGKKFAVPEWGNVTSQGTNGGNDNPAYVNDMLAFFQANAAYMGWESTFQGTGGVGVSYTGATTVPLSAAAYQAGWNAPYPDATTTGPAAGGYTSPTPVTGAQLFSLEPGHGFPSWCVLQGDGSYLVENCAFGAGSRFFISVAAIKFKGCSIICNANDIAINYTAPVSAVATGSNNGNIASIATWGAGFGGNGVLCVVNGPVFPAGGGNVRIDTSAGQAVVHYSATSGNTLINCTLVSGSGTVTSGSPGPPVVSASAVKYADGLLTLQYCSITAPDTTPANRTHACVTGASTASTITIDRCDFQWWEQGIQCAPVTNVTNSYIHDPVYLGVVVSPPYSGDHTEPVELPPGSSITASNCTLLDSLIDLSPGAGGGQTAVIAASTNPSSFQLDHCLVGGGGYVFDSYPAATNIKVTNCKVTTVYFANGGQFNVFNGAPAWTGTNVWSGNTWNDGPNAGQHHSPAGLTAPVPRPLSSIPPPGGEARADPTRQQGTRRRPSRRGPQRHRRRAHRPRRARGRARARQGE